MFKLNKLYKCKSASHWFEDQWQVERHITSISEVFVSEFTWKRSQNMGLLLLLCLIIPGTFQANIWLKDKMFSFQQGSTALLLDFKRIAVFRETRIWSSIMSLHYRRLHAQCAWGWLYMISLQFVNLIHCRFNLEIETGVLNWLMSYSVATNPDKMNMCKWLMNLIFVDFYLIEFYRFPMCHM